MPNDSSPTPVLVVDDNADAADSLAAILQLDGYAVRVAYDGVVAMELAETIKPRAIVLDLGMPRADGYTVAQWVRQQSWGRQIPIVALSGWGQDADRERTRSAGFDAHLVKPIDPIELERLLARFEADRQKSL